MAERDNYSVIADGDQLNEGYFNDLQYVGVLGEVRMFEISTTGAVTKATLQSKGWAICDGTTPADQGISSADITAATLDMQHTFIRMSNDESSGDTGGADTVALSEAELPAHTHPINYSNTDGGTTNSCDRGADVSGTITSNATGSGTAHNNIPSYVELAFFRKSKISMA